ncbi:thioesterase family protein [Streptococcus dentiloxodontae]
MSVFNKTYTTNSDHSARSLGSGSLDVLATPALVAFMENAAYEFIQKKLDKNQTTVGSEIAVQHLVASSIGQDVTIVITALLEEGHRYDFRLEAYSDDSLIAKANHTRVRVDSQRFLSKLMK